MLRKDNLLDEKVANEQDSFESTDDRIGHLDGAIEMIRTKLARLMAEMTSTTRKLRQRVAMLEDELARCRRRERNCDNSPNANQQQKEKSSDNIY